MWRIRTKSVSPFRLSNLLVYESIYSEKTVVHVEKRFRKWEFWSLTETDRARTNQENHFRKLAAKFIPRSIFINQSIVCVRVNQTWFVRSSDGSSQDASRFGGSRSLMYGVSYVVKTSKRRISRTEKKDVNASLVLIENEGVTFFFFTFLYTTKSHQLQTIAKKVDFSFKKQV